MRMILTQYADTPSEIGMRGRYGPRNHRWLMNLKNYVKFSRNDTPRIIVAATRAIFVWPWNKNARTIQKQQTNRNRAIWLVYRTHTNAGGFWLVKWTLGWKNFMPENFLETNPYFALTSYCNTIGQSNNAFSILGFSLAGKLRGHVLIFSSIGW